MHGYTVAFRIFSDGEALNLEAITKNLGIIPTDTRQIGEARTSSKMWTQSMWGYSLDPDNNPKNWDSFEEGLASLLKIFMPLKKRSMNMPKNITWYFGVGTLPPVLMADQHYLQRY